MPLNMNIAVTYFTNKMFSEQIIQQKFYNGVLYIYILLRIKKKNSTCREAEYKKKHDIWSKNSCVFIHGKIIYIYILQICTSVCRQI